MLFRILLPVAIVATLFTWCGADDSGGGGPDAVVGSELIDLDVPASSAVGDFIGLLEKKYPRYAINVSAEDLKRKTIGVMKFSGANFQDVAQALRFAGLNEFTVDIEGNTIFLREIRSLSEVTFDIDLPAGGTVKDLVGILKANYPQFVYDSSPKLDGIRIGELSFRKMTFPHFATALAVAAEGKFSVQAGGRTLRFDEMAAQEATVNTYNISPWLGSATGDEAAKKVRQLDEMIKGIVAIANGVADEDQVEAPKCAYLPKGHVYVVTGNGRAVWLADKILKALNPKILPGTITPTGQL